MRTYLSGPGGWFVVLFLLIPMVPARAQDQCVAGRNQLASIRDQAATLSLVAGESVPPSRRVCPGFVIGNSQPQVVTNAIPFGASRSEVNKVVSEINQQFQADANKEVNAGPGVCAPPCRAQYEPIFYVSTQPSPLSATEQCQHIVTFPVYSKQFSLLSTSRKACTSSFEHSTKNWIQQTVLNPWVPLHWYGRSSREGKLLEANCPDHCSLFYTESYRDVYTSVDCKRDLLFIAKCGPPKESKHYVSQGFMQNAWQCTEAAQ